MGLTNPLTEKDLKEFIKLNAKKKSTLNSWFVNIKDIDKDSWDLTVNNPNRREKFDNRSTDEIINEIEKLKKEENKILSKIKEIL